MGKIDLKNAKKRKERVSQKERDNLVRSKGDEIAGKKIVTNSNVEEDDKKALFVVESTPVQDDELMRLLDKLPKQDKFIKNGLRQQSSINTSDYTSTLIDILVEAKKREGEKIKKTSYLEKFLIQGLKKELKDLGIEIK